MTEIYAWMILNGTKEIEDVPEGIRADVEDKVKELTERGIGSWD